MNIWMGSRVTESIADIWWDEAEEYGTWNYLDVQSLSWVGVASAFSEQHRQFIVVAVYEWFIDGFFLLQLNNYEPL